MSGLARLQGVVRSRSVKRQTVNAMKQMQLLGRVQMQIQSRRSQMFQALHSQAYMNDKEVESTLSKWTQLVSLSCYISCGIHLFSGIGRCHILEALFAYII